MLKVPRKSTILNRCTSTESCWNKNDDSLASPEIETNRSPSSYKKRRPFALMGPIVSKETGMKMCLADCGVFFLATAASAAAPGLEDVNAT